MAKKLLELPSDVLQCILNEIEVTQQGPAVLTCRLFKQLLYSNPRTTLDLSRDRLVVNDEALIHLLRRHPNLQDLDVTYCYRLTRASLAQIKLTAPTLRRLSIGWNSRLDSSLLTEILSGPPTPAPAVMDVSPPLKRGCLHLQCLDLRGCWNLGDEDLKAIARFCPALTHANFDYCAFSEAALKAFVESQGSTLQELSIFWTDDEERPPGCGLPPRYSRIRFPSHMRVFSEYAPPTSFTFDYDTPFPQQLKVAKEQAQEEGKRILLHVALENSLPGGDSFTQRLHNFLTTNREIKERLDEDYVYLIVDNVVFDPHRGSFVQRNLEEFPTLFVLSEDGQVLAGKGTGDLEENCNSGCCYNPIKMFHFLRRWKSGAVLPSVLPDLKELSSQAPINPLYSFSPFHGGLVQVMPAQQDGSYD